MQFNSLGFVLLLLIVFGTLKALFGHSEEETCLIKQILELEIYSFDTNFPLLNWWFF